MLKNKNLLLISYYFPPDSNGGTGRPYALYKYLNKFGLKTTVITLDSKTNIECDSEVYRAKYWKKYGIIALAIRMISFLIKKIGLVQYNDLYWQYDVLKKYKEINKIFDYVYVTYPSIDSLNIGLFLAKKYNIKLISEFRDGLVYEPLEEYNLLQKIFLRKFEKNLINNSSLVITVGKAISNYFEEIYNHDNIKTIYNGYDDEDFELVDSSINITPKRTKIIHIGSISFSKNRSIESLFIVLGNLFKANIINNSNFELLFVGNLSKEELSLLDKYNIKDIVKTNEPLPKRKALKISENYNYLLLYGVPNQKTYISSKLFEYIKIGKPIVGICKGNEAEIIINSISVGNCYGFDEIEIAIVDVLNNNIKYSTNLKQIDEFSRIRQMKVIYDEICEI